MPARRIKYSRQANVKRRHNPYFRERRHDRPRIDLSAWLSVIRPRLIVLALFILALAGLWLVLFSPWLAVKTVAVEVLADPSVPPEFRIASATVEAYVWERLRSGQGMIAGDRLITLDQDGLRADLKDRYHLESVKSLSRLWQRRLEIAVAERAYYVVWREGGIDAYLESNGLLIREETTSATSSFEFPVISNESTLSRASRTPEDLATLVGTSTRIYELWAARFPDLKIERFKIDDNINTITLKLANGPDILFNISENIEVNLGRLETFKNETLKEDLNKRSYIDLRYGDRVYYK